MNSYYVNVIYSFSTDGDSLRITDCIVYLAEILGTVIQQAAG